MRVSEQILDERCKECGVETATWFTDSDIWNLLDTPGILCPNCFMHLIEACGFATTGWKLVPEERVEAVIFVKDAGVAKWQSGALKPPVIAGSNPAASTNHPKDRP